MFDTFMSLPLHVLVLHFAVVLIPMGAAATVAVMLRPAWRDRLAMYVAAGNLALLVLTFVTVRAGYALQEKLDPTKQSVPTNNHEQLAETLLWIMVGLTVVSVITWLAVRMDSFAPAAATGLAAVVAVLAVTSAGFTVVTGHTGSDSHWGSLYAKSSTVQQSAAPPGSAPSPPAASADVTMIDIKDFKFVPAVGRVEVGQKITVTNQDRAPHTLTAIDKSVDSKNLDKGESYTFTVEKAGEFPYICDIHQYMEGSLTVS